MVDNRITAALSPADREILEKCGPLAELKDAARTAVIEGCEVLVAPKGTVIIHQGEHGDSFYVVLEGTVEVLRIEENGREIPYRERGPGAYFGEQALLGDALGRRTATVRAASDCRCGVIPAELFSGRIARTGRNTEAFERNAAHFAYDEIRRSLEAFASKRLDESADGVARTTFRPGATIVLEGEPSDAAFLVLEGVARVVRSRSDSAREVSRVGTGQVIGELGVLRAQPRAATVTAESEVVALRIEAAAFREWHAAHPGSSRFFDSLAEVYSLSEGRRLSVFLGDVDGEKAITTLAGEPTSGMVSTRILDRGVVVFANAGADAVEGDRESVVFSEGSHRRELRVIVQTRKSQRIETCVIQGVAAEGVGSDLGELYHRVSHLDLLTALELRRFERTGYLGGAAHARSKGIDGKLCPCLGIGPPEMRAAIEEMGTDFSRLRTAMGVSTLCGGCEPAVRAFIDQTIQNASAKPSAACPIRDPGALETSGYPLRRIERLLRSWAPEGDGLVSRQDVAVRLRGLGVHDMNAFIDTLFPGVLLEGTRAPLTSLVQSIAEGMDFDPARILRGPSYAARQKSSQPAKATVRRAQTAVRFVLRHRHSFLVLASSALLMALLGVLGAAYAADPSWLPWAAAGEAVVLTLLSRNPSLRYYFFLLVRGEARLYSAMFSAFGSATQYALFKPLGPFGPKVFYIRGEEMVDQVLNRPNDFVRDSRFPLDTYPPFGVKSLLWGGVDGYWLGYRNVCEEYFVSGYEADLGEMADIVRERVRQWRARGEIDLLDEIYRIVLEIRARVFFQTTFHCFDDQAPLDFAKLIDRVLSGQGFFFVDDRDAAKVHERVMDAVLGATRPGSVGYSLRQCLESGDLEESEVLHNAVMYVLAQAPTMAIFWTLYRAARTGSSAALRGNHRAMVRAIKEEMRVHPPVTSMFFRIAARDAVADGVSIPQGSPIFVCPFLIQTNPAHWTSPEEFDVERWTSASGVAREIVEPKTDQGDARARPGLRPEGQAASRYLPFGAGPHACQGRWFASDEMLLVVDTVLGMVDLEVVRDEGLLDRSLADQVTLHVYSRPANDVRLKVVPRDANPG